MTALFVDSFTREIPVYTVSVTEIPETGLVLRLGAHVGNLWQLTAENNFFENSELPVIVATRGYSAQSSAGHVKVLADYHGEQTRIRTHVVGIHGFHWMNKKSLRALGNPMEILVLRPGTNIRSVHTHAGRGSGPYPAWHSNPATADAAAMALEILSEIRPSSVFIAEGQSDYVQAWELSAQWDQYRDNPEFCIEFPAEHRAEMFTPAKLFERALWYRGTKSVDEIDVHETRGLLYIYCNLIFASGGTGGDWPKSLLSDSMRAVLGDEIFSLAGHMMTDLSDEGWTLHGKIAYDDLYIEAMHEDGLTRSWGRLDGTPEMIEVVRGACEMHDVASGNGESE
ncbi:hypothetical protein CL633_03665 [bacterium]|nr:hypothetical protein [bacterium]|tara:strand:+ start:1744 stop:2763 length:1020 start_codon:yes stop_codon:yes gene_type:complete